MGKIPCCTRYLNQSIYTFSFEFFFSVSNTGNFWVGINNSGNGKVVDMRFFSCKFFSCKYSLFFCFMSQHGTSNNITDSKNSWDIGFKVVIDNDSSFFVKLDSCFFTVQTISVGSSSGGNKNVISFQDLGVTSFDGLDGDLSMSTMIFA